MYGASAASGASVTLSRSAWSTSAAGTELISLSGLTEAAEMGCGALAGASSPPAAGEVPVMVSSSGVEDCGIPSEGNCCTWLSFGQHQTFAGACQRGTGAANHPMD